MKYIKLFEEHDAELEHFKKIISAALLRKLMNIVHGANNKTASSRATGARKSLAGDYLYRQDRGMFDAYLADIKSGTNQHMWQNLYDHWKKTNNINI